LSRPGKRLTIVDINPISFVLAHKYFNLPDELPCIVADFRKFVFDDRAYYDGIAIDVGGPGFRFAGIRCPDLRRHPCPAGRARSNVWSYAGATSFGATRDADLAMHPTVKPVAMIADAILDASQPKGAVLDCFAGSGSTLVAAAKTRRIGYGVELDPIYCDVILTRLARVLKVDPVLQQTGKTFTEMAAIRSDATAP
jgi:hypothetical protein